MYKTITVKELIEKLKEFNQDAPVLGVYDYLGYPIIDIGFGGDDGCTKQNCSEVLLNLTNDKEETI